jgi:hypothetical protein
VKRLFHAATMLSLASSLALADFPYTGYFGTSFQKMSAKDVAAQCTLKFFLQKNNGDAEDYFLDIKTFEEKGQLIFLRSNATSCTYVPERKTEDCKTVQQASDRTENFEVHNYLQYVSPDYLETIYFTNKDEYQRFMASDRVFNQFLYPSTSFIYYYRCPHHSDSSVGFYLRKSNTVDYEETDKMLSPVLDGADNLRGVAEKAAKILFPQF